MVDERTDPQATNFDGGDKGIEAMFERIREVLTRQLFHVQRVHTPIDMFWSHLTTPEIQADRSGSAC